MSLADFIELAEAVAATSVIVLAVYVGVIVYKRDTKVAPPERRHRTRSDTGAALKQSDRRATRLE